MNRGKGCVGGRQRASQVQDPVAIARCPGRRRREGLRRKDRHLGWDVEIGLPLADPVRRVELGSTEVAEVDADQKIEVEVLERGNRTSPTDREDTIDSSAFPVDSSPPLMRWIQAK